MEPVLKYYTVLELRNWLVHNQLIDGLSDQIIAPQRAWAIINNPYVNDSDAVVCAIYEDNEVAAYTSAFPELIGDERKWWFSALWCNPKYRGQGYGLIVIGSLAEMYGVENCFDKWGAPDTVEIFTYLGHKTSCTKRYILGSKIQRNTTKGNIVYLVRKLQKTLHKLIEKPSKQGNYSIRYLTNIDDTTYEFIKNTQNGDWLVRSQQILNWILQYSFTISAPLTGSKVSMFSPSEVVDTQFYAVQVYKQNQLVGFYIMKKNQDSLHILYLYYLNEFKEVVYSSIKDHIKYLDVSQFTTEDESCAKYIYKQVYFSKHKTVDISFSYPKSFCVNKEFTMQYGDGDNFCVYN